MRPIYTRTIVGAATFLTVAQATFPMGHAERYAYCADIPIRCLVEPDEGRQAPTSPMGSMTRLTTQTSSSASIDFSAIQM